MRHSNKIVVIFCILFLTGILAFSLYTYKKNNPIFRESSVEKGKPIDFQQAKENRYIFAEKQPVYALYGRVDNISGTTLGLTQSVITPVINNQLNDGRYIVFTIRTNKDTQVFRGLQNTTKLVSSQESFSLPRYSFSDIKIGNYITVYSNTDLRLLEKPEFLATKLEFPRIRNVLEGHIATINGNVLTIDRKPFAPPWNPGSNRMHHSVSLNNSTEISYVDKNNQILNLNEADLKAGMQVRIYSLQDVEESDTLTAFRIEPIL